ncbi:hypothetical protein [Amycolatopsis japonica]|uniref:hypothetical protein n=1 Tax=Amycolatopsis japonica TaxID=208439 RepID=UPI0011DD5BCA|nr:hypothetical protein [Amycolatopsis japonica]
MRRTDAVWRKAIAAERDRLHVTQNKVDDAWLIEHSPSLFGTPPVELAAGLAYRTSLTVGFGDNRTVMAARQAVVMEAAGMLADPAQQERITAVLAFVSDPATCDLSGAVVADKVRALLDGSRS